MRARWLFPLITAVVWTDSAGAQSVPAYPYPEDYPVRLRHASPGQCDPRDQHACVPDKCYEVVQQAINGASCGNIYAGFPLAGLSQMYVDEGYRQYGGPLRFLGCVPSSDNTCQIHILGVGSNTTTKDACQMPRPGCYFALSQGPGKFLSDVSAACSTANSGMNQDDGALKLVNPQDRQCIADMVAAGQQNTPTPKKLACHSWGTAFCDQNGFYDAEYYGGLCPSSASMCAQNHGDRVSCAIYSCAINSASLVTGIGSWMKNWRNPNWGATPQYVAPDRQHCLGDTPATDSSYAWDLSDRHSFAEYLADRDKNPGNYSGQMNTPSRTTTSTCSTTHDHGEPLPGGTW